MTRARGSERSWVGQRFGVALQDVSGEPLDDLVQVALRRNPKRAHLLVSTVLGKHLPTDPRVVHEAGLRLGRAVADLLVGENDGERSVVIGYAETATALGHCVAEGLGADCLHSTRRAVDGMPPAARFEEAHSHATGHLLLPEDADLLRRPGPIVLVDDELSTGATALATISSLQRIRPRARYLIAALVDLRSAADRDRLAVAATELGTSINVVALGTGSVRLPADLPTRAAEFVGSRPAPVPHPPPRAELVECRDGWPAGVREGGRHGFTPNDRAATAEAAAALAERIAGGLIGNRVLVLGCEELMYAPLLIALALCTPEREVRFSTTTRSPVCAVDEPGYAIRTALTFPAHDASDPAARYAYNVAAPAASPASAGFTDIVLVLDGPADTPALRGPDGLLALLRGCCDRVHLVTVPAHRPRRNVGPLPDQLPDPLRGPAFGSYAADEVGWLLTDLSDVELEAPTEEREEAIQSGGAHYAESLPIEYQPSAEYQALFAEALDAAAGRVAHAVGVVTELVLAERGPDVVLASLARAGTPIGVLMRRWAGWSRGLALPHYAVSIVRGRGIDEVALRCLADRHDPREVQFVDGWTGKGAIARELAAAVAATDRRFCAELAVLADPGSCVRTFGTRADFLIPSACLNSTASGLVSRTVLNRALIAPGRYHGAKFYRSLAPVDMSARFLDAVTARFAEVAEAVARDWPRVRDGDRVPRWTGWAAVESISDRYGVGEVNLVKPGVGETTRVLLRRVPWRILIRPGAEPELRHVLLLAGQRGVPVETVPGLPYSCVGLIRPTR